MPQVTVVVPTFNEGGNIAELVQRLERVLTDAEILFVDDSNDDTPQVIAQVASTSAIPVRLRHRQGEDRRGGLSSAVVDGIMDARGEHVVVMDGDLQHPPELAPDLVHHARAEAADVVVASRYRQNGDASGLASPLRTLTSQGSTLLARGLFPRRVGRVCSDPMTGFFCLRRAAIDPGRLRPRGFKILLEILASHRLRVSELPFTFGTRQAGESKASFRNGSAFLLQLLVLRTGKVLPFAAIGGLGLLLNLLLMFLLMHAGAGYLLASVVATVATIASNFLLQEWLVFTSAPDRHVLTRLAQTFAYNSLDTAVRLPFLVLLVEHGVGSLWAQALTVVVLFGARFAFTSRVIYRRAEARPVSSEGPPSDAERYAYLQAPQGRWIFWAQAAALIGVAVSMYGLATNSYWSLVFFAPLVLMLLEQTLALRTSTLRRRITLDSHREAVTTYNPDAYPSVDVFLPTAGEPMEVLASTYRHVAQLTWPGRLDVHVLDDADRPSVRMLADAMGFHYLARPGSEFKKAGNLQYAFERSNGDHIAILDADFMPRSDFLPELLPYMEDAEVGIVQSPQYFNTDPAMSWLERAAGATQEMFFRFVQPSRDAVAAAICVGTSAVYRRSALEAIGGFPLIGHSEDVYTGVLMARKGFRLRYVPTLVTRGACPDDVNAFIAQQYRWCEGSMSLLADRGFHEDPSMTVMQRISFWSGFLYYITTAVSAVVAPLAVIIMIALYPERVQSSNMLPLAAATVFWLFVYPMVAIGRWRFEVFRVQAIYGFAHLFCIMDLIRGRAVEWVATGAATAPARPSPQIALRVRRFMGPYLLATQAITGIGLLSGAWTYGLADYWANIALALLNFYVFVPTAWVAIRGSQAHDKDRVIDLAEGLLPDGLIAKPGSALAGLGEPA